LLFFSRLFFLIIPALFLLFSTLFPLACFVKMTEGVFPLEGVGGVGSFRRSFSEGGFLLFPLSSCHSRSLFVIPAKAGI
jgi:hypothetical protein